MTKDEERHQDRVASLGCIACFINGTRNWFVSIHHVDGRTKPGAHTKVLPLCFFHHQGGAKDDPSVHPWKRAFEKKYGTQKELLTRVSNALTNGDYV